MRADELEARMRTGERFHSLALPPESWVIIRVDGRGFSRYTEDDFDKPFDARFSALMTATARGLLEELGGRYAYTESDEVSLVLPPAFAQFGRRLEKLVSVSASVAASVFTHAAGEPVQFDSRVWLGGSLEDVVDYLSWRQADAARCALNGWCYWALRKAGRTRRQAARALDGAGAAAKHELLSRHGVDYEGLPAWQRNGVGLWWETYEHPGHDPLRGVDVTTLRRRVHVARELPVTGEYRGLAERILLGERDPGAPVPP
ncbi:tRNA(His) guanylyltransferase Thg1 family protein [Spongiactinospora sp. TRM90649]|uniref:tRNA(His) guanylyltransferase Thg1 family protein n=1 Tax=Spongiactinospora sp. TRM90649 TaxID=3031114 RepID=UPI0023F626CD|nr:tRNA(His) guanylyltransferase Thg1 family protein [Spongiactinospora sp. TRM90649]MDF5753845.1 tRNA(His) guanylyltransferase Thg1 family protein [Spongiactinospora sp. TRM90649]